MTAGGSQHLVAAVFLCAVCSILAPLPVEATSTGLDNIPTTDTPPDRTGVIQIYTNQTEGSQDDYLIGYKMGLRPWGQIFEWGVDGRLGEGEEGPAVLQLKYVVDPGESLPQLAVGATNVAVTSSDRERAGQAFVFMMLSHDFGWFRGHAGHGFQKDNDAFFFGWDKTYQAFERDLILRGDLIQIDDQQQWLGSLGFFFSIHKHLALESWVSQPFENGKSIFTLKLNLIFEFP